MNAPQLDPTQRRILQDLQDALEELDIGSGHPDDAAVFDALGTLGQARRLAKVCDHLEVRTAVSTGERRLETLRERFRLCFRKLRPDVLIETLASALNDDEPETVFDTMYDLDLTLCALETAGLSDVATALREDAIETVDLFADESPTLRGFSVRMLDSLGTEGGAAPIWREVGMAASRIAPESLPMESAPPWLDDILAADSMRGVLQMVPISRSASSQTNSSGLQAAASMGGLAPVLHRIDEDRAAQWELMQRESGPEQHIVLYWLGAEAPPLSATEVFDGKALQVHRPDSGNEAYVVCSPGTEIVVRVANREYRIWGPR